MNKLILGLMFLCGVAYGSASSDKNSSQQDQKKPENEGNKTQQSGNSQPQQKDMPVMTAPPKLSTTIVNNTVSKIKDRFDKIQKMIASTSAALIDTNSKIDATSAGLTQTNIRNDTIYRILGQANPLLVTLDSDMASLKRFIAQLAEISIADTELTGLLKEISSEQLALDKQHFDLETELNRQNALYQTFEASIKNKQAEIVDLSGKLAGATTQMQKTISDLNDAKSKLRELERNEAGFNQDLNNLQSTIQERKKEIAQLTKNIEETEDKITNATAEIDKTAASIKSVREECASLEKSKQESMKKFEERRKILSDQRQDLGTKMQQLLEIRTKEAGLQQQIKNYDLTSINFRDRPPLEQIQDISNQIANSRTNIGKLEEQKKTSASLCDQARKEYETRSKTLNQKDSERKELIQKEAELTKQTALLNQNIVQFEQLKEEQAAKIAELQPIIDTLNSSVIKLSREKGSLEEESKQRERDLGSKDKDVRKISERINTLDQDLSYKLGDINRIQKNMNDNNVQTITKQMTNIANKLTEVNRIESNLAIAKANLNTIDSQLQELDAKRKQELQDIFNRAGRGNQKTSSNN